MFKTFSYVMALAAIGGFCFAATPAKPHKKRHPAATTAPSKGAVKALKSGKGRKTKATVGHARSFQQAPTPERYREIQQALVSKGYMQGEPSGQWGTDSADALKRFQADQSLMPDGKINSLSLIALGLGPKRLTAKSETAPPAPPAPQQAPPQ